MHKGTDCLVCPITSYFHNSEHVSITAGLRVLIINSNVAFGTDILVETLRVVYYSIILSTFMVKTNHTSGKKGKPQRADQTVTNRVNGNLSAFRIDILYPQLTPYKRQAFDSWQSNLDQSVSYH